LQDPELKFQYCQKKEKENKKRKQKAVFFTTVSKK
jgi:hypothetical protein